MAKKFVEVVGLTKVFDPKETDTLQLNTSTIKESAQATANNNSILFITSTADDVQYGYPVGSMWIWTRGKLYNCNNTSGDLQLNTTMKGITIDAIDGNLIPGMQYRITDYNCPVATSNMFASAGHPFDIIVTAISNTDVSPYASAAMHLGNMYFGDSELSKWEITLDVSNKNVAGDFDDEEVGYMWRKIESFSSSDEHEGKYLLPVIVHMKDEFGNEAPYDFKNILYKKIGIVNLSNVYTFRYHVRGGVPLEMDASMTQYNCKNNVIESPWSSDDRKVCYLPYISVGTTTHDSLFKTGSNNIYVNGSARNSIFESKCRSIIIDGDVTNCHFGSSCLDMTIYGSVYFTTFEENCNNISVEGVCNRSIFRKSCHHIYIYSSIESCEFGIGCHDIDIEFNSIFKCIFGCNCFNFYLANSDQIGVLQKITIGNGVNDINIDTEYSVLEDIIIGNNSNKNYIYNTGGRIHIGDHSSGNEMLDYSAFIVIGNESNDNVICENCRKISIGNHSKYNTIGENCSKISIGNDCTDNEIGLENIRCQNINLGNNCNNNNIQQGSDIVFGSNCWNNFIEVTSNTDISEQTPKHITLGNNCWSNNFKTAPRHILPNDKTEGVLVCCDIVLGDNCVNNRIYGSKNIVLGPSCQNNTISRQCKCITLGQYCFTNNIGQECAYIKFGDGCDSNTLFGSVSGDNTFDSEGQVYTDDYYLTKREHQEGGISGCYDITFGEKCINNYLCCTTINAEFGNGVSGLTLDSVSHLNGAIGNLIVYPGVMRNTITLDMLDTYQATIIRPNNTRELIV